MIVIAVMVLAVPLVIVIGTMAFVFVLDNPDDARWEKARADMGQIREALSHYSIENNGEYPADLSALEGWGQAFPDGVPTDPFTNENYIYEPLRGNFKLTCYGKDATEGGEEIPDKDIIYDKAGMISDQYE